MTRLAFYRKPIDGGPGRIPRLVRLAVLAVWAAMSASSALAGDASEYRLFRLGTDLRTIAAQANLDVAQAIVIQERPALIQELEWHPDVTRSSSESDPVRVAILDFYNGTLYRIYVDYQQDLVEGLSANDLVQPISRIYGEPLQSNATVKPGSLSSDTYTDTAKVIAQWADANASVNLVRSSYPGTFGLVILSKQLDSIARAAMIKGAQLAIIEAPQRERERAKREATDARAKAERVRMLNLPNFQP